MSIRIYDQRCCNCAYHNDDGICMRRYPLEYKSCLDWCLKWKDYAQPVDILDICFGIEPEDVSKLSETNIENLRS
jgi:hypothetical protein